MNKKFVISSLVMTVAALLEGFVVHAQLLNADYLRLTAIFRPESEAQGYFGFMLLAHLLQLLLVLGRPHLVAGGVVLIHEVLLRLQLKVHFLYIK